MKKCLWCIAIFTIIIVTGCTFSLAQDVTPPVGAEKQPFLSTQPEPTTAKVYPLAPPDAQNGKELFLRECAPCHGVSGLGDGERANQLPNPVPAIASKENVLATTPAQWFLIVTKGNLEYSMPPFPDLTDRERWDVIAYTFFLGTSDSDLQRGAQLYTEFCLSCHGQTGKGNGPQASSLAISPTDLTNQAFMAEKSGVNLFNSITKGVLPYMPEFSQQIPDDDRWILVEYLRTFTFNLSDDMTAKDLTPLSETVTASYPTPISTEAAPLVFGNIFGTLTNGSDGDIPAELEVTLYGFDSSEHVFTQTTKLLPNNTFAFNNIELIEGRVYAASVDFEGMTYGSDFQVVPDNVSEIELPITIFESTSDISVIKIDRLHLFFELLDESTVRVVELYIMSNTSNKTLIPSDPNNPAVRFKLPVGSSNLEFQDGQLGERFLETPDGFGDLLPVVPGTSDYQVLLAFEMPYNRKLDFVQPVLLPVDAVVILVPEGEIRVKGENIQDEGTRDIQDNKFHLYNGGNLSRASELRLSLTGHPADNNGGSKQSDRTTIIIGSSVLGFALVLVGLWLYRHARFEQILDVEDDIVKVETPSNENIEALMDAIIAIDDLYQVGELPEDAYQKRRAELKDRLRKLTEALQKIN